MVHKWKIVIIESLVFFVLSSLHNYKFLENWTKISWFIQKWKIILVETLVFLVLSSFHNY
jgi:hypothetical protein